VVNLAPVLDYVGQERRDLNVVMPVLGQPMGILLSDEQAATSRQAFCCSDNERPNWPTNIQKINRR
jgi:hypothetical protein